jgi:Ca2+-binding EF-hand superfamily protein
VSPWHLALPGVSLRSGPSHGSIASHTQTRRSFFLSQFRIAAGEKASLTLKEVEQNPGIRFLVEVFPHADRNGDGQLSVAELKDYLELMDQGAQSQVLLQIEDRGRNLFDLLDANQDGLLDLRELRQAAGHLASYLPNATASISRGDLPLQIRLSVTGGAMTPSGNRTVDGITIPGKPSSAKGPLWFRKMDRNQDGFLSPNEFLGPPEMFERLDKDGDGLISVEEAELAGKP